MPKSSTAASRTGGKPRVARHTKAKKVVLKRSPAKRSVVRGPRRTPGFESDAFEAIYSAARDLHEIGAIDKQTMRSYDALCISPPEEISPDHIRELRLKLKMSQPVFAMRIGASPSTVEKWESGVNKPTGIALKFLHAVEKFGVKVLG